MAVNLHNTEFIKSAVKRADFIRDGLPGIVFSGKSNVGKSSVINRLLNRKNFARVGASPGKTVHINYFQVDEKGYFVEDSNAKKTKNLIERDIDILVKKLHIYLKAEWNRVKYESQGKTYEKETREFDILELEKKYDNPDYKNNVWKRFCIDSKAKIRRIWNSAELAVIVFIVGIMILIIIA